MYANLPNTIRDFDPSKGCAFQGDISIVPVPAKFSLSKAHEIDPKGAMLVLAEGEGFGNFHALVLERPVKTSKAVEGLIADALARKIAVPTARLFQDDALLSKMINKGPLTDGARRLSVGFLCVEHGPMVIQHIKADGAPTGEHDGIRIPERVYWIGRQVESVGAEERVVSD
jgi:hypothetical protein